MPGKAGRHLLHRTLHHRARLLLAKRAVGRRQAQAAARLGAVRVLAQQRQRAAQHVRRALGLVHLPGPRGRLRRDFAGRAGRGPLWQNPMAGMSAARYAAYICRNLMACFAWRMTRMARM